MVDSNKSHLQQRKEKTTSVAPFTCSAFDLKYMLKECCRTFQHQKNMVPRHPKSSKYLVRTCLEAPEKAEPHEMFWGGGKNGGVWWIYIYGGVFQMLLYSSIIPYNIYEVYYIRSSFTRRTLFEPFEPFAHSTIIPYITG